MGLWLNARILGFNSVDDNRNETFPSLTFLKNYFYKNTDNYFIVILEHYS